MTPWVFGPVTDVGVHNLWPFAQGDGDYVGVATETAYGNFHIYDITDPTAPVLVSFYCAMAEGRRLHRRRRRERLLRMGGDRVVPARPALYCIGEGMCRGN